MLYMDDKVTLLNISIVNMVCEVKKRCALYYVQVDKDKELISRCINKAIEVEVEETEGNERRQRTVIRRKNDTGVYISIKNIRFFPTLFLDGIINIADDDFHPIVILSFLWNLLKQLAIEISKKELLFYSIIYFGTKKIVLTDDNLLETVKSYMNLYGYDEPQREDIYEIVGDLEDIKMISIIDGRYFANEKFYF